MIRINYKENCCGCFACKQICPKQCSEVITDNQGFLTVLKTYFIQHNPPLRSNAFLFLTDPKQAKTKVAKILTNRYKLLGQKKGLTPLGANPMFVAILPKKVKSLLLILCFYHLCLLKSCISLQDYPFFY